MVLLGEGWREYFRGWFPEGSDDPGIALLRVDSKNGEYWDEPWQLGALFGTYYPLESAKKACPCERSAASAPERRG